MFIIKYLSIYLSIVRMREVLARPWDVFCDFPLHFVFCFVFFLFFFVSIYLSILADEKAFDITGLIGVDD